MSASPDTENRQYLTDCSETFLNMVEARNLMDDPLTMEMFIMALEKRGYMFAWDEFHDLYFKKKDDEEIEHVEDNSDTATAES